MITGKVKSSTHPQIKEIISTSEMREIAKVNSDKIPTLKNSILKGEGRLTGAMGEEGVKRYLGISDYANTFNFDIIYKGKRLEVKTLSTTVTPKINYACKVCNANTRQDCDYYIFCRSLDDLSKVWIMGFIRKKDFYNIAEFVKKGTPEQGTNYIEKADCYKTMASYLVDIDKLNQIIDEDNRK